MELERRVDESRVSMSPFGTWKIRNFVLSVALIMDTMTLSESAHLLTCSSQCRDRADKVFGI